LAKVIINTGQQQFIFICEVTGRSHLIVKLSAIALTEKLATRRRKTKDKQNTMCVGHHSTQANTTNIKNTKLVIPTNYRLHRRWRFNEGALYYYSSISIENKKKLS
jgi:hypothetical protein